jgi:hypothetical protein
MCGGGKWTQKMLSISSTPPNVFFLLFFHTEILAKFAPPQSQIYTRKTKKFPIYFSEHGEIKPDKIKRHLPSIRKGAHEGPARKKRKFLNLQSSFSQATHIRFVF